MDHDGSMTNVWSLSSAQLSAQMQVVADGGNSRIDAALQAEAKRLCGAWIEALKPDETAFDKGSPKALELAALRKRTIQVLVHCGLAR